jgi:hypothetical protein
MVLACITLFYLVEAPCPRFSIPNSLAPGFGPMLAIAPSFPNGFNRFLLAIN